MVDENMNMIRVTETQKMNENTDKLEKLKSSLDIINRTALELIASIERQLKEIQHEKEGWEMMYEKESLLLIQNSDLSKYSLVSVREMDAAEIVKILSDMNDNDKLNIVAYLESRGAWVAEIANEKTREFREYHLDVRYNTDTNEVIDLKLQMELNEKAKEPTGANERELLSTRTELVENGVSKEALQAISGQNEQVPELVTEKAGYPPVYVCVLSYAIEHGEVEEYKASRKLDRECKNAIEETIRQNFDGMYLNHDIVKPLSEQFGSERIAFVLASTLLQEASDARFSRDNVAWASQYLNSKDFVHGMDMNHEMIVSSHPAVLDGFIGMFRREVLEQEKELSLGQEKVQEQTVDTSKVEDMDDGDEIIDLGDEREQVLADMKKLLEGQDITNQQAKSQDHDGLMEKVEVANRIETQTQKNVVEDFKTKTNELFREISEMNSAEIEETVKCHVQEKLEECGIDAKIVDVAVVGSRCRGMEREDSDLDVVVELSTNEREDVLFDTFNDGLQIGGVKVDINPITAQRTGTLETYLPQVEDYLEGVREARQKESIGDKINVNNQLGPEVTLTVAECGEFHNIGEFYENIPTVDEALSIWKQIRPERMNGIPSIGINVHIPGTEAIEDVGIDILSGKRIELDVLDYIPDIKDNPKVVEIIAELIAKLPGMEIDGMMGRAIEEKTWDYRTDLTLEERLAVEIDRFVYSYDECQYRDIALSMTENIEGLADCIKQGDISPITEWLANVIVEITDQEEITRAKELLEKLTVCNSLVKIGEKKIEGQNCSRADNMLNNGVGDRNPKDGRKNIQGESAARTSLKERLADKKRFVSGQGKDNEIQENVKNGRREMQTYE